MSRIVLLLFLLCFSAEPLFADIIIFSFNKLSAIGELEARAFVAMLRRIFIYEIYILPTILILVITWQYKRLIFIHSSHEQDDPLFTRLVRKSFYVLIFAFLLTKSGTSPIMTYSATEDKLLSDDEIGTAFQTQDLINYNVSFLTERMTYLLDSLAGAIYVEVKKIASVEDGRPPMLMQAAMSKALNETMINDQQVDDLLIYVNQCRQPFIEESKTEGYTFQESFIDEPKINEILEGIKTSFLTELGKTLTGSLYDVSDYVDSQELDKKQLGKNDPRYYVSCLTLRDLAKKAWESFASYGDQQFETLEAKFPEFSKLNEDERDIFMTYYQGLTLATIVDSDVDPTDIKLTSPKDSLVASMLQSMKKAKFDFFNNRTIGNPAAYEELLHFYHKVPIYFKTCVFFLLAYAEVAIIIALVSGRWGVLIYAWAGYFILKLLPSLWIFLDSSIKGYTIVLSNYDKNNSLYDPDFVQQVINHYTAIQGETINLITLSFGLLLFALPSHYLVSFLRK